MHLGVLGIFAALVISRNDRSRLEQVFFNINKNSDGLEEGDGKNAHPNMITYAYFCHETKKRLTTF